MADIRLPDGTIVKNVPDGITQSELMRRINGEPQRRQGGLQEGVFEAGLQLASGIVAGPASGIAGLVAGALPGGKTAAEQQAETQEALTFQPRTQTGQDVSAGIGKVFEPIERFADAVGERSGDPDDALGATLVKTAILGAPALFGLRRATGPGLTSKQQALTAGRKEGYVVPPSSANPKGFRANVLEGVGGKLKTAQEASVRNQVITNKLAARAVGLTDDIQLTPEVLSAVRKQAGQAFEQVKNSGQVITDVKFHRDLSKSASQFRSAARDFPKLAKNEVVNIIDDIRRPQFDAGSGVSAIRLLRDRADVAFRGGDKSLGNAYKAAADAVESSIERHLVRSSGNASLIDDFKSARQQIAQTYTIEKALEGSNVSAPSLASQLKKGAPLSGDLKAIAQFAQEFPKAARVTNESFPSFSPLDLPVIAGSVAGGVGIHPSLLLPAAVQLSRPAARSTALSNVGQRLGLPQNSVLNRVAGTAGVAASAEANRKKNQ